MRSTYEVTVLRNISDYDLLKGIEARLDKNVVQNFTAANSHVDLEEKYEALYKLWRNLQTNKNANHDDTLDNNLPSGAVSQSLSNINLDESFWFNNTNTIGGVIGSDGELVLIPPNADDSRSEEQNARGGAMFADIMVDLIPVTSVSSISKEKDKIGETCENVDDLMQPSTSKEKTPTKSISPIPTNTMSEIINIGTENIHNWAEIQKEWETPTKNNNPNTQEPNTNVISSKYPTPFKNALYWPENTLKRSQNGKENKKSNKKPKIYPTVAISDDFMEHQRRIIEEKKKKENEKYERQKRREDKNKNCLNLKREKVAKSKKKCKQGSQTGRM